ncbi:hypothetical protein MMC06_006455 [Schaereria dolodes]|nr:hypothetical protein [Schaereria dolodes]
MPYPLTAVTTTTTSQSPTTSSSDQSSTSVPLSQSTTTSSAPAHLAAYGTGANPAPIQYPAETTSKSSYHNKSSVYTSAIETSTASPPPPIAYPSGAPSDQAPKILPSVPNTFAPYGTGTGLVPLPSATYSSVPYPTPDNGSKPVGSGSAVPPTSSPLPGSASAPRGGYVGNNNSTVTAPATGVSAGPVITMDTSAPPTVTTKTSSVVLTSTAGARANEAGGVLLGAGMLMVAML